MPAHFQFTVNSTLSSCFKNKISQSFLSFLDFSVHAYLPFSNKAAEKKNQFSISFHLMNLYLIRPITYCAVPPLLYGLFILCQFLPDL